MANKQTDVCGTHFPSCGPTQRALDGWYAPRFFGFSLGYKNFPFLSLSLASRQ